MLSIENKKVLGCLSPGNERNKKDILKDNAAKSPIGEY